MSIRTAVILSALLLAGFLVLRPVLGRLGAPGTPDVRGRSSVRPPVGVSISPAAEDEPRPSATPGPRGTSADPAASPAASCSALAAVEKRVFDLTNEERRKAGLTPLSDEATLHETALTQSGDMMARAFFDHINPDGLAPEDRVAVRHRRLIGLVGENIWRASGFGKMPPDKLAHEIVTSWMKSPGHRENILRPKFTHLGVGVCSRGDEVRATQNFAQVLAYLDRPLPDTVARGTALALALTTVATPAHPADAFDLWSSERGLAATARAALVGGRADVDPGVYMLRIYFTQSDPSRFAIVPGPQIEVK